MLGALGAGTSAPAEPEPSAELLLYLGEFEDAGGEFVDPMALDEATPLPAGKAAPPPAPRNNDDEDDDESAPRSA